MKPVKDGQRVETACVCVCVCVSSCPAVSRYDIMYSCWRVDPLDRPAFSQLLERLEKLAEKLPESSSRDDIIYINTSIPEEEPADTEPLDTEGDPQHPHPRHGARWSPSPTCAHQAQVPGHSVVTADVHGSLAERDDGCNHGDDNNDGDDEDDRYVVVISSSDPSSRATGATVDTPLLPRDGLSRAAGNGDHTSCDKTSLL